MLMRDVSGMAGARGRTPHSRSTQHLRFLDHLAAFHAATWGWSDDVGLLPLVNRYSLFAPVAFRCEEALGFPQAVPRIGLEGWRRLGVSRPHDGGDARDRCTTAPWPTRRRARGYADSASSTATGSSATSAVDPDGRTVLVDWSLPGEGPPIAELAHYLALNRARLPLGHSKDDAIDAYRAALERHGIDTAPWLERQLALGLLGVMLQLGWEKAFDETGIELEWWAARPVREPGADGGARSSSRTAARRAARAPGSRSAAWSMTQSDILMASAGRETVVTANGGPGAAIVIRTANGPRAL